MRARRRFLLCAAASAVAIVVPPSTAVVAHPGHERPQITVMRWEDAPVTACDSESGQCDEETLIVKAHDPDSSITEVQVWFDEGGDRAPFVMAHTYCLQGKAPGTPARLELPASYTEPGEYTVAAVAFSHKRCSGHEQGDGHPALHSRIMRLPTTVEPASP